MSRTLLYHGFEVEGYSLSDIQAQRGAITLKIRQDPGTLRCPSCRSRRVIRRGTTVRPFRTVPIGKRRVFLELPVQRVKCRRCGALAQVDVRFAAERRTYTFQFEHYALDLTRSMTIKDVALHLGVSWDVIKDIQKRNLKRRFSRPRLDKLRYIAIDEISIGKGHRYLTVVLDLASGAVVFVGDGRGADALKPFWKRLRRHAANIKAVAMDMSPAYIAAVTTNLPKVPIIFDRFHIVKLFNERLSELRRDMQRARGSPERDVPPVVLERVAVVVKALVVAEHFLLAPETDQPAGARLPESVRRGSGHHVFRSDNRAE